MLNKIHRLTERYKNGTADAVWRDDTYPCHKQRFCPDGDCVHKNKCDFAVRIERLAEYEDTRLTPDDIIKLKSKVKRLEKRIKELKELQRESQIDNPAPVEGNADNTEV